MNAAPQLTNARAVTRRWLPLILGLGLGIRITLGWMHPFTFPDSVDYETLARALAAGEPYVSAGYVAARMPGYPLFLAAIYALGGGAKTVMMVQALLGGCVVYLTYLIGRRLGEAVGLWAALLVALDPLSIGFSVAFLSETPFTVCLMAALWICLRIIEEPARTSWGRWIALGVLWGVAVYLRAAALWAIVPLGLWTAWRCPSSSRARFALPVISVALVFALLSPWLIRNYRIFHSGPMRLTTLEGISLYEAVYPDADGGPKQHIIQPPPEMRSMNEAQRNDEWNRRAWAYMRAEPLRIAKLALLKVARTWAPWFHAAEFRAGPIQWMMALWNLPLFLLAVAGLVSGMRRDLLILLLIPMAYFTAIHAFFLGSVRYRAPLMPLVCLLAAYGMVQLAARLRHGKRSAIQVV